MSVHAAPARAASDDGWPRSYDTASGARITLYQPQVARPDQKHMTRYAAVAYLAPGAQKPELGTLKIESDTQVALNERLVNFSEFNIAEVNFPTLQKDAAQSAIEQTTVARAVNTDKQILRVGDLYYMCYEGVWFVGNAPSDAWQVADSIPQAVYRIPISSPAHNVTYATVEDFDSDCVDFAAAVASVAAVDSEVAVAGAN